MIEVPDEKVITGLTRTELIAMVYALKKERDVANKQIVDLENGVKELVDNMKDGLGHIYSLIDPET